MMRRMSTSSKGIILSILLMFLFLFTGCEMEGLLPLPEVETQSVGMPGGEQTPTQENFQIDKAGFYTSKEEVSQYIHLYGELPGNFLTKNEAKKLGWDASKGNLFDVTDKKSIGGDRFYNREGKLPNKEGRKWYEADIDYRGGGRGAKRMLYSSDGLIYYTGNHYDTFQKLYGEE